ncbi:hypothetical protein [Glaciecola sp. SC05]|uniref:hypothetical protein n=1 Tax=Glaciecola sp. SC05 TaxID=1987355 RepID=UPI003527A6E0
MDLFYQRTETNEKVVVIFRPYSMYVLLVVLLALMAITFVPALVAYEALGNVLIPIAAVVVIARIVFMYKVNQEVQNAIRSDSVTISGSKLSAKNPLTFVITKTAGQ